MDYSHLSPDPNHTSGSFHVLRNSLAETVVIDIYEVYEDMFSFPIKLNKYVQDELIRQIFMVFDSPAENLLEVISSASVNFLLLNQEFVQENERTALNELFRKSALYIYFRCYEHKLFVGTNYPTIPRFPYYLENSTAAGCILRLDTTYF